MSDSYTSEELQQLCPRFRVLVLGRRNAGKTTILKKMAGSEDGACEVRDRYGELVDPSVLEPTQERGMSNIEHEITFKSNPKLVFHDSRGIEAGAETDVNSSELCIDFVHSFIMRRASEPLLKNQLHAIWFCIPVDKPRVPSAEFELRFFNRGTLSVPVIAVFTKFEALIDKAYEDLLEEDKSDSEAEEQADGRAQNNFNDTIWRAILGTANPPSRFVQLQKMNEVNTSCEELTEQTYAAMTNEVLADIFGMAQQNSFRIGCQFSFRAVLRLRETIWQRMLSFQHGPIFMPSPAERDNKDHYRKYVINALLHLPGWKVCLLF